MPVQFVTYTSIEPGVPPSQCRSRSIGADGDPYLTEHVEGLLERARRGDSPPATFTDAAARDGFTALLSGDEEDFMQAAPVMANGIQSHMDGRAKPGLLVAVRFNDGVSGRVGVLKLEVKERYAGILKEIERGERELAIVRDYLTGWRDLQKGCVVPDPRSGSDVVVGDKLGDTALYFLVGVGVRQMAKPSHAVTSLFKVLTRHAPERAADIARHIQEDAPATFDDLVEHEPDLFAEDDVEVIREEIRGLDRPIGALDPHRARGARRVIRAGGITIAGPLSDMDAVTTEQLDSGRWRVSFETDAQPNTTYEF